MLIYSMGVSLDGFIADRDGSFDWSVPSEEEFRFHLEEVRGLDAHLCGRRLYETMLVWETDPAMRETPLEAEFADAWTALPKIVLSRTLDRVEGNATLAQGDLAEVVAGTEGVLAVGGADLGAQAVAAGLVDELQIFRHPVLVGGGKPLLPPVTTSMSFDLIETRTFADRVVLERYARTGGR